MAQFFFPSIDMEAFGKRFQELRKERKFSVKDIQNYFGFEAPQAIYKWQTGQSLPSTDHLLALSILFDVPMEELLVYKKIELKDFSREISRDVFLFGISLHSHHRRYVSLREAILNGLSGFSYIPLISSNVTSL